MFCPIFIFAGDTSALGVLASALKRWTSSTAVDEEASPKHGADDNDKSKIPFFINLDKVQNVKFLRSS